MGQGGLTTKEFAMTAMKLLQRLGSWLQLISLNFLLKCLGLWYTRWIIQNHIISNLNYMTVWCNTLVFLYHITIGPYSTTSFQPQTTITVSCARPGTTSCHMGTFTFGRLQLIVDLTNKLPVNHWGPFSPVDQSSMRDNSFLNYPAWNISFIWYVLTPWDSLTVCWRSLTPTPKNTLLVLLRLFIAGEHMRRKYHTHGRCCFRTMFHLTRHHVHCHL